jgi:hypothetical protein
MLWILRRIKYPVKTGLGKDEFPGKWQLSTPTHRAPEARKQCINTVGKAQLAERGALFWLRRKPRADEAIFLWKGLCEWPFFPVVKILK